MSLFSTGSETKLVKARKEHTCWACGEVLPKGEYYVRHKCLDDKYIISTAFCECCFAGAKYAAYISDISPDDFFLDPDETKSLRLKVGDMVHRVADGYTIHDEVYKLNDYTTYKVEGIKKGGSGMYAIISSLDGETHNAIQLTHLIKIGDEND